MTPLPLLPPLLPARIPSDLRTTRASLLPPSLRSTSLNVPPPRLCGAGGTIRDTSSRRAYPLTLARARGTLLRPFAIISYLHVWLVILYVSRSLQNTRVIFPRVTIPGEKKIGSRARRVNVLKSSVPASPAGYASSLDLSLPWLLASAQRHVSGVYSTHRLRVVLGR